MRTLLLRSLDACRFLLFAVYSATEPLVRFVVLQLFPHCGVHCLIRNVGTGRFDDYISFCNKHALSAKHRICVPWLRN